MHLADTLETGELRTGEIEAFLQVMCVAFGMDLEAARPIFYSDPYFELYNRYAVRLDGKIVSCLTVVDRECWIGDATIRVAGIAGVATLPDYRRRGFARRLLTETLNVLDSRGLHIAALFPADASYYRSLGWEPASKPYISETALDALGGHAGREYVRAVEEADIPRIAEIYDRATRGRAMHCRRDSRRWDYLLTFLPRGCVACAQDGSIGGYALFDVQQAPDEQNDDASGQPPNTVLRILEIHSESPEYSAVLRRHMAAQERVSGAQFSAPLDVIESNGFPSPTPASNPFMARVVNWPGLLAALAPNWHDFDREIGLLVVDPLLSRLPRAAIVSGTGSEARIESLGAPELVARCRDYVVGEIGAWSAVIVGHLGAAEACHSGALKASTPPAASIASRLFPERAPFLPAADHF